MEVIELSSDEESELSSIDEDDDESSDDASADKPEAGAQYPFCQIARLRFFWKYENSVGIWPVNVNNNCRICRIEQGFVKPTKTN